MLVVLVMNLGFGNFVVCDCGIMLFTLFCVFVGSLFVYYFELIFVIVDFFRL